jgi:hypothetical protein
VDGGTLSTLASGQGSPLAIAVNIASIYWTNDICGTVMSVPLDGSAPPVLLASGQSYAVGIVADERSVYWTTQGTVTKFTPM